MVLFHLDVRSFSGGFVGVDVFFVISGFLITRLILHELGESGTFSFGRFYGRRIRRLGPAMLVTITASFVAAYFLFAPDDLRQFGGSVVASVLSVSNIFFWHEAGYFDTASTLKPLLHTWSLSVEEQFYLTWPLALVTASALMGVSRTVLLVVTVGVISFLLNLWVLSGGGGFADIRSSMFFLPFFRVFELAIGAALVWVWQVRPKSSGWCDLLVGTGFAMIALSIVSYDENTPFPAHYALLPCIGTALLILSGDRSRIAFLLTNRLSVGLGLVSYSLYLVHWPLIVFWRYSLPLTDGAKAGLLVASVAAAALMYRFVEQPFRHSGQSQVIGPRVPFIPASIGLAMLLAAPGAHAWASKGWLWRLDPSIVALIDPTNLNAGPTFARRKCFMQQSEGPDGIDPECYTIRSDGRPNIIVVGDSTAAGLLPGLGEILGEDANLYTMGASLCPPLLDMVIPSRPFCRDVNRHFFENVITENKYDLVIMKSVARGSAFREFFPQTRAALEKASVNYLVLGRGLQFKGSLPTLVSKHGKEEGLTEFVSRNLTSACGDESGIDEIVPREHFLSLKDRFCDVDGKPIFRDGKHLYYMDPIHVSRLGSKFAAVPIRAWLLRHGILAGD